MKITPRREGNYYVFRMPKGAAVRVVELYGGRPRKVEGKSYAIYIPANTKLIQQWDVVFDADGATVSVFPPTSSESTWQKVEVVVVAPNPASVVVTR